MDALIRWLQHFKEVQLYASIWAGAEPIEVLTDKLSVAFIGTVVFGLIGAWRLYSQFQKISRDGAAGVSVEWTICFLAMFITLLPYGLEKGSLAYSLQFFMRVPFYLLILPSLYRSAGGFSRREWRVVVTMTAALLGMLVDVAVVSITLLWVGVFIAAHQPWKIFWAKKTEGVDVGVLVVYFCSTGFWAIYGWVQIPKDWGVISWAVAYSVVYFLGIVVYVYRRPKVLVT